MTETLRIAAMASAYDILIPHCMVFMLIILDHQHLRRLMNL